MPGKKRRGELVKDLERIAMDHPDDIEARAFAVGIIWRNQYRLSIPNAQSCWPPMRSRSRCWRRIRGTRRTIILIHLWDHERDQAGAGRGRPCAGRPRPGARTCGTCRDTFIPISNAGTDSAWQQEAAARVDHAQMIRNHIFPDQIHNFAHNSEWLVRNLNHHGRVREALAVSMNLIAMPRIPRSKKREGQSGTEVRRKRQLLAIRTQSPQRNDPALGIVGRGAQTRRDAVSGAGQRIRGQRGNANTCWRWRIMEKATPRGPRVPRKNRSDGSRSPKKNAPKPPPKRNPKPESKTRAPTKSTKPWPTPCCRSRRKSRSCSLRSPNCGCATISPTAAWTRQRRSPANSRTSTNTGWR